MSNSVRPHRRQPTRLPCPWDSPGKNTGGVAISFSNAWKWKVKVKSLSYVRLLATLWTAAYQAPLSMGFSRQEYWSGLPLPSPIQNWPGFKSRTEKRISISKSERDNSILNIVKNLSRCEKRIVSYVQGWDELGR